MPLQLGASFATPVRVEEPAVHVPTVDELRNEQLLVAIAALREALVSQPAPVIQVAEPDLSAIVTAVNALKGPSTAEEIAGAVVSAISPGGEPEMERVLREVVQALKTLDYRLTGLAAAQTSGGGPSTVSLSPSTIDALNSGNDTVTVSNFPATQPVSGTVAVSNFPTSVEVSNDAGNPLPVTGTVMTTATPDVTSSGTVQAVGSTLVLPTGSGGGLSAFSFDITGFTTGQFVIERTLNPNPASGGALWTPIGAFRAGTRTSASTWTNTAGAFHGNMSASTAVRVRVTQALDAPATVNLLGGRGTGTITVGAIASNEGNIIGTVADLEQHYASAEGGYLLFNATTGPLTLASGASGSAIALFENPAGSGRDLRLFRITTASARQAVVWERFRTPTVSTRGTAQANVNRGGGTPSSVARLYVPGQFTTAANGSSAESHTTSNGGTDRDLIRGGIRLRPGDAALFRASNIGTGLGGDATVAVHLVWADLPAVTP